MQELLAQTAYSLHRKTLGPQCLLQVCHGLESHVFCQDILWDLQVVAGSVVIQECLLSAETSFAPETSAFQGCGLQQWVAGHNMKDRIARHTSQRDEVSYCRD
jgi:hypothetical protein